MHFYLLCNEVIVKSNWQSTKTASLHFNNDFDFSWTIFYCWREEANSCSRMLVLRSGRIERERVGERKSKLWREAVRKRKYQHEDGSERKFCELENKWWSNMRCSTQTVIPFSCLDWLSLSQILACEVLSHWKTNDGWMMLQELWDRIQSESKCCGIDGPFDYNLTKWLQHKQEEFPFYSQLVPRSCCRSDPVTHLTHRSHNPDASPLTSFHHYHRHLHNDHRHVIHRRHERSIDFTCVETYSPDSINVYGCYDSIFKWFQRTIETLSVLGFCVITFLKLCFAFILRYEIKEMIQKIQMLKGEGAVSSCGIAAPLHELEAYLPRASIQQETFETQLVSNQCQSPPSSSIAGAQSTAETQRQRLNSRVEQVRQSLTSASTITTTAVLNSPLKSPPLANNANNNDMTSSSSTRNRIVRPSPV